MDTLLLLLIAAVLAGVAVYFVIQRTSGKPPELEKRMDFFGQQMTENMKIMMQQMADTTKQVNERIRENTEQMNLRLKENIEVIQRQHRSVGERLDNAAKVVNSVTVQLSKLQESNKRIHDIGKDLASLQEILRAPKLRGGLGELFLENLLAQIFPRKDLYAMQYTFKSGEKVDAVIFLRDGMMVSVDAKFPLENFKKMADAQTGDDERGAGAFRKAFMNDVKKHVDDIARKYILPEEGTLDFALMYIPAENVYYETITKNLDEDAGKSISQYALSKHVVPVSPNTFYIYLQTLLVGLKGMQIEKGAKEILKTLGQLKGDFMKFAEDYELVGTHLGRAQGSFEKSEKRLERFQERLERVEVPGASAEPALISKSVEP